MGILVPGATTFALATLQCIWVFPIALGILFAVMVAAFYVPTVRGKLLCRMPAFKEATVSHIAAALEMLLKKGVSLPEAVGLVKNLEASPAAAADLQQWQSRLASGVAKFSDLAAGNRLIPPMFAWIVSGAGENLTEGFRRAAEIYHARALYRTEVALFSVLPLASVFLGAIVISQAFLVISMFLPMFVMLSDLSGNG
jgi:type II secretory pathway component PulF